MNKIRSLLPLAILLPAIAWSQNTFPSSGNVGIGTTNPAQLLHVSGGGVRIDVAGGVALQNQDLGGNTLWSVKRGSPTDPNDMAMRAFGGFTFAPANSDSVLVRIANSGYVGIGTQTPAQLLHVSGGGVRIDAIGGVALQNQDFGGNTLWSVKRGSSADSNDMAMRAFAGFTFAPANSDTVLVRIASSGYVGIGTTNPTYPLTVNGTVRAKEVIVDTGWSDYVFADNYQLSSLSDVEAHIKAEKHLPGIPSAKEVAEHGINVGEMQAKLLAKIEELTLHQIEQEKEIATLKAKISELQDQRLPATGTR